MVCDGPDVPRSGAGSPALGALDVGVSLDLDEHPRVQEARDDDQRRHRPDRREDLAVDARDGVGMTAVGHVHPRADDVGQRRAGALERRRDVGEGLARLRLRIAERGERPVGQRRRAPGDPDVRARAHDAAVADALLEGAAGPVALHQWRTWRRRVTTIATPAASAAAPPSASRTEPPGWMIARTPPSIARA